MDIVTRSTSSCSSSSTTSEASNCYIYESNSDTNSIGNLSEVDEIFLGVEPYLFEPEYDTLDELMVEASANANLDFDSLEPIVESRAGNLDWCSCGNCRVMGRDIDSVCCREVNAIPEESFEGMFTFLKAINYTFFSTI